jgi:endonuclease YncB( thermonuclease family)
MNHKHLLIILSFLVAASVLTSTATAAVIQTDKTGTVTSVIDGSTFTISTGETIKLAEITTPASGEAGFESSRSYLANMIQGKPIILDVDTLVVSDQGKFLCVAYLDFNSSHYENINKAMLENSYAAPTSTRTTEFNPSTWTWFVAKETAPTPTPTAATTATATPSPTPTPFSGPTPSITPDISQPTATPTPSTTPPENTQSAQMQTWIIIAVAGVVAAAIVIVLIIKRKK